MKGSASELLTQAAAEMGLSLSDSQVEKFALYLAELREWNKKINLTALKTDQEIVSKHFIDSLTPLPLIPPHSHILDIGSGAGFPGIPLKIAEPAFYIVMVEAKEKKVFFLRHIIRALGLQEIRAEHLHLDPVMAREPQWHEKFDVVISRAAFDLKTFLELSRFLLREKGHAIALKGPQVQEEIDAVGRDIRLHAFHLVNDLEVTLPITHERRRILLYRII
ncbi:MAG: 16S rRNA (guanine(527)-N(7))-methyltransferase RsmG [Thermodesulfobacteriota bacterium]